MNPPSITPPRLFVPRSDQPSIRQFMKTISNNTSLFKWLTRIMPANSHLPILLLILAYAVSPPANAADFTWNGGSGNWDTVTANWNGTTTWVNGADSNAIFGIPSGAVFLTENITADTITMQTGNSSVYYQFIGAAGTTLSFNKLQFEGSFLMTFNSDLTLNLLGAHAMGDSNDNIHFNDNVIVNANAASSIGSSMLHFNDNTVLNLNVANAAPQEQVGASTYMSDSSTLNVNVANAANQHYFSVRDNATMNAIAENGVHGGLVRINANAVLNALVTNAFSGTTIELSRDSVLQIFADNALGSGSKIAFRITGSPIVRLNGHNLEVASIRSRDLATGIIENTSAVNAVITVSADATTSTEFSGLLRNGGSGTLGLVKAGDSTLTLSGDNTYTGNTTVNGGTLIINGNQSAATGLVTVNTGATLSGSGIIGGSVVINNGGHLAAGTSPGMLTMASLTLNSSSHMDFEFGAANSPGNPINDVIQVNGDLVLDGVLNVSVSSGGSFGPGFYRMFNYTGVLTNNGVEIGTVPVPASELYVQYSIPNQINLINKSGFELNFWDGNNPANYNDGVVNGGDGTWILNPPNDHWTDMDGTVNVPYENGQFVIFQGTPGTVTVDNSNGNVTFAGAQFAVDGYSIEGAALTGSDPTTIIRVGDGSSAGASMTATIRAEITGDTTLQKDDLGTLILSSANTYTGGTQLNAGTLYANHDNALGTGAVVIQDNTTFGSQFSHTFHNDLVINGNFTIAGLGFINLKGNTTLNTNTIITLQSHSPFDDTEIYFDGVISGSGGIVFNYEGASGIFFLTNHNLYEGPTILQGTAALALNSDTGNALPTDLFINDTAMVGLFQSDQIADTANVTVNSPGEILYSQPLAGFTLNGHNETILGLYGSGNVQLNNGSINGYNTNGAGILTVGEGLFSGVISDAGFGGQLVKNTPGILALTGANTYNGGTIIEEGTLQTANLSALGSGLVTLNHAILQPVTNLNLHSLDWNDGNVRLVLGPTLLHIDGNFTKGLNGGEFILDWDQVTPLQESYTLLTYDGATNFTSADFSGDPNFNIPNVAVQHTYQLTGDAVLLNLTAQAWGPLLQNSGPVLIPTFADFFVRGQVRTGTVNENNTIKSLHFDPGSNLQVYNKLTVTSGKFTVPSGKATIQGGTVLVPGEFHKLGAGTLDARSNFNVQGNSYIHSGKLAVNGRFQTPVLHVLPGGILGGNGVVVGHVINGGTVAPGNSIGLLTILGNYTQQRSGTLQIEVSNPSHHDVLAVSGAARLAGTLEIASLGYRPKYGDQIPFLRAGKITGRFDSILMPQPQINRGRFLNLGKLGVLLVAPTSYTLVAKTPDQTRVARALDHWIGQEDGDIGAVTLALDLLRENQYPQAFEAIMPGFHHAALNTAIELSHSQGQLLHQQLSARRLGQRIHQRELGQRSSATATATVSSSSAKGSKAVNETIASPTTPADADEYRWSTWFQGSGLFSQGGLSLTPGENFESGTFIAGADYALADNFAVGLFAGYGEGWGDYDNGGKIDLERILIGTYATLDVGNFYLNAALGYGTVESDIRRPIQFATLNRTARSEADGHEFFALLGGGYDFRKGNWTFGPQASLQYSKVRFDPYSESGARSLDLRMNDPESDSLRSHLGARVAYTIEASDRVALIPEVRVFWQHEFLDGDALNASLNGGHGPEFLYEPSRDDQDSVFLGVGLGLQVGTRFYANLYYNADLGRDETIHQVSVTATVRF